MALARADLSHLRQHQYSAYADCVLIGVGESRQQRDARLFAVQTHLCRSWGVDESQLTLFASEGEATALSVQASIARWSADDVILCTPTRPGVAQTMSLGGIRHHNVPRNPNGLPTPEAWSSAVASWPNAIVVVGWEPDFHAELESALQGGVRPERLVVLAVHGFVGQLPWPLEIRPAAVISALRDPDAPDPPLAWISVDWSGQVGRMGFGATADIALPALSALESVLYTADAWPAWITGAVELLQARAAALQELVKDDAQLALWPRRGGEALIHCVGGDPEALANLWCQAGWSCRAAKHPVYGDFVAVDLYASQPLLGASKEWPVQP